MRDDNNIVESYKALTASRERRAAEREKAYNEAVNAKENARNNIYGIMEKKRERQKAHRTLIEGARNDSFSTALKSIYITALNPYALTDNALIYAESLVDGWIKENGGANKILTEHKNDTYFLNRLATIVEDAAQAEVRSVEEADDDKDIDDEDESKSEDKKEDTKKEDDKEDDSETKENTSDNKDEDSEESDNDGDDDSELDDNDIDLGDDTEDSNDDLGTVGLDDDEDEDDFEEPDPDEDALEDDDVNDALGDPIDDEDEEDLDDTIDGEGEEKGQIFKDLDQEPDVKKAVNIIQQRVADAEENFIKNNAEDKKKINDLITKVSDNVKTVEDINDKEDTESKIAEESARMYNRKITAVRENRPLTIFEKLTRELGSGLLKDEVVKEQFIDENGQFDMASVIESAKVQYAFLETLNTLQLEKMNENRLTDILNEVGK